MRRYLAYLVLFICAAFALYAPKALAGPLVGDLGNGNRIELVDSPCKSPAVLKHLRKEFHSQFMSAVVVWEGKRLAACWTSMDPQHIYVVDETGDHGPLPFALFQTKRVDK